MQITDLLNHFKTNNLRKDILGGMTAAIVSFPLALAFGVASGAGAEAGLYGAIIIGLFAAMFGGTPTLISEPTGPMTVVMTAVIATLIAANPEKGLAMAFTVVMIAGVFQVLLGALKLGRYITLMPYSVISGFMSGIGVILIIIQLPALMGSENAAGGVINTLLAVPSMIPAISAPDVALGLSALAMLFFIPRKVANVVPPQLIALVLCTVVSVIIFAENDVRRIGEISLGLPDFYLPTFTASEFKIMLVNGIVLGALGCIDSLLTAVISDSLTRHDHKSDKELIGQGIGNVLSGMLGGLPGAGATMGTVVNIQAGARSAYSGVTRAVALVLMLVLASELIVYIPMAVLAAIAIRVGLNILDWSFVKKAHRISMSATLIMYSVLLLTVFVDLIVAVGVGMFVANLITIDRLSQVQERNIRSLSVEDDQLPLNDKEREHFERVNRQHKTLLVALSGPMIFGVSKALQREAKVIEQYEALIVDIRYVSMMDATISMAIQNLILDALDRKLSVNLITKQEQDLKALTESLENPHVFNFFDIHSALENVEKHEPDGESVGIYAA